MTLRFRPWTLRPIAAMLLAFALLIGGAVDAAACEFEAVDHGLAPTVVSLAKVDQSPAKADAAPKKQDEPTHGDKAGCAHGHCHHGTHSLIAHGRAMSSNDMAEARYAFPPKPLTAISLGIPKQPPRL